LVKTKAMNVKIITALKELQKEEQNGNMKRMIEGALE